MTTPIQHGYPDYGRTAARANVIYHNINDPDIDGQETLPRKFVGDRAHVGFFIQPSAGGFNILFSFHEEEVAASEMGSHNFDIPAGKVANLTIPVCGPWLEIIVTPSAVNSAYTFKVWGTDYPDTYSRNNPIAGSLISQHNVNVGAGATANYAATKIWPGPVSWHVKSTAASWQAFLESVDYQGNVRTLDWDNNAGPNVIRQLYLPHQGVNVRVVNLDAAIKVFYVYVNAHPFGRYG
jgi:hypothetical protein